MLFISVFWCYIIAVLCTCLRTSADNTEGPIVSTIYGKVKGRYVDLTSGGRASVFLGIPYAAPPTGIRRFAIPEPPETWSEVKEVTEHPPRCLQMNDKIDFFVPPPSGDSEDCLTVNIFTTSPQVYQNHAVMVFIHGGHFHLGSAFEYGVEGIVNNFLPKEVVVVLVQYRLGLFGFLATNDPSASGNWGLWDQIEALKWIRDNIAEFGGDPERVTIFGESAGAASISLLSYIPAAQEYFSQSIEQSGSGYTLGVLNDNSLKATSLLADAVGCRSNVEKMVVCLRELSADRLLQANRELFEPGYKVGTAPPLKWNPVIDGYLIPDTLENLAMTLQIKPAVIGTNNLEMAMFIKPPAQMKQYRELGSPLIIPESFSAAHFDLVIERNFPEVVYPNSATLLRKLCRFHYLESSGNPDNKTFVAQQYIQMIGDLWFYAAATKEAVDKANVGSMVWMYSFDYYSQNMFAEDYIWKGAHHASELYFLFGVNFEVFNFTRTHTDENVANTLATLWTNFAKYGDPTKISETVTNDLLWPIFRSFEQSPTMHIGASLELRPHCHLSSSVFWNKLLKEIETLSAVEREERAGKTDTQPLHERTTGGKRRSEL